MTERQYMNIIDGLENEGFRNTEFGMTEFGNEPYIMFEHEDKGVMRIQKDDIDFFGVYRYEDDDFMPATASLEVLKLITKILTNFDDVVEHIKREYQDNRV